MHACYPVKKSIQTHYIYIYRRLAAPTSSACWPNAGLAGPPECDAVFLICRSISAATRGSHPKNVFSSGYSWLILLLNHEIAATQDVLCWTVFFTFSLEHRFLPSAQLRLVVGKFGVTVHHPWGWTVYSPENDVGGLSTYGRIFQAGGIKNQQKNT